MMPSWNIPQATAMAARKEIIEHSFFHHLPAANAIAGLGAESLVLLSIYSKLDAAGGADFLMEGLLLHL